MLMSDNPTWHGNYLRVAELFAQEVHTLAAVWKEQSEKNSFEASDICDV